MEGHGSGRECESSRGGVPSLQEICKREILKRYVTVASVVDVMRYFEQVDWMVEQGPALRQVCQSFVLRAYESIKVRVGEEAIKEVVGADVFDAMNRQAQERQECVRKIKIVGKVVERTSAKDHHHQQQQQDQDQDLGLPAAGSVGSVGGGGGGGSPPNSSVLLGNQKVAEADGDSDGDDADGVQEPPRKLVSSVSGKSSFPYCSLRAGFKWPSEVDPSNREEYLSNGEFQEVFGVSFREYQAFPSWKKLQMKKDKLLF